MAAVVRFLVVCVCLVLTSRAMGQDHEALIAAGGEALNAGDHRRALAAFEAAQVMHPDWRAASGAGVAACALGQHAKGAGLLRASALLIPDTLPDYEATRAATERRAAQCEASAPPIATVAPHPQPLPVTARDDDGPSVLGIAGLAAGGAAVIAGVALVLASNSKANAAEQQLASLLASPDVPIANECGAGTPLAAQCDQLADAERATLAFRNGAIGAFAVGGALAVGGVVALILDGSDGDESGSDRLSLNVGLQGVTISGAW